MFSYEKYSHSIFNKLPKDRLVALDVFRGITITAMILVNNPGSWSYVYAPMAHAQWHGWTPTDLIFPFFIFIVGVALTLSLNVSQSKCISRTKIVKNSAVRMLKLLALGWFLALFYFNFTVEHFDWVEQRLYSIRVMGVLQRIGIVYFITVVLYIYLGKRSFYLLAPFLLLLYAAMMMLIPYSDEAGNTFTGLLEKGNNFSAWLDHNVLTAAHVYQNSDTLFAYDPEGILTTLPAISTCITGVAVGDYLQRAKKNNTELTSQIFHLSIVGSALMSSGLMLDTFFPINKILWSPSYVLFTSGIAMLCFALCIFLIDYRNVKNWSAPFIVFGANSIAFFMFAGVIGRIVIMIPIGETTLKGFLFDYIFQPVFGSYNGSLFYAVTFLLISYMVFHVLYQRNIIFKV